MKAGSIALLAGMVGCAFAETVSAAGAPIFTEKVLWSFRGGKDGGGPTSGLIDVQGTFYGTTEKGGSNGYGTVFALTAL